MARREQDGRKQAREWIYGIHSVMAVLDARPHAVRELRVLAGRHDPQFQRMIELARAHSIAVHEYERRQLDEMVAANHQGVIASVQQAAWSEQDLQAIVESAGNRALLLILDGVQDPHNLGACLRTANAAGVHAVIAPRDRSVGLTAAVRKVASGAAEATPFIQVGNLGRSLRWLKEQGVWIAGLSGDGESELYSIDLKGPLALVLGAEGSGLRHLTGELCDYRLRIPMRGTVESLNVSVATGICLYEVLRQRGVAA
ncbi:MAG TPA: 23S rRNA (guanosine(2251)-2'-O)-methyltransferase RlmB [Gammaproteobacteria bacterium]|nr:23S rRNA (guanosine(2251)-2'-O)-methyltransferase RlmB [Gammaproteobacteria bacterium]